MGVFHLILRSGPVLASPFQLAGAAPCPTPVASGPRYAGQSAADRRRRKQKAPATTKARGSIHESVFIHSALLCAMLSLTAPPQTAAPWHDNLAKYQQWPAVRLAFSWQLLFFD